jgi:hypothetical protein
MPVPFVVVRFDTSLTLQLLPVRVLSVLLAGVVVKVPLVIHDG